MADRLADREAQRRSYQRVDAFARKWGSHPLTARLDYEVSELDPRTTETLLAAARTGPGSVNFTGYASLMRFVKAGGAFLSFPHQSLAGRRRTCYTGAWWAVVGGVDYG